MIVLVDFLYLFGVFGVLHDALFEPSRPHIWAGAGICVLRHLLGDLAA